MIVTEDLRVDDKVSVESELSLLDVDRLYAEAVRERFRKRRYAVVPNVVSRAVCDKLVRSLASSRFIAVDIKQAFELSRFYTKNGEALAAACPALVQIEQGILRWVKAMTGEEYAPLDNRAIGFSLNVTPPGGGLGTHHDRNKVTVILYLNDIGGGGELCIYPKFPTFFGHSVHRYAIKFLNSIQNPVARLAHDILFRPELVTPKAGTLVVLTDVSEHRVEPMHAGPLRYSFVMGFDRPGVTFNDGSTYYGHGEETITLTDLATGIGGNEPATTDPHVT